MSEVINSSIRGAFYGWSGETLFRLRNGQYWVQKKYSYKYRYAYRPNVTITRQNGNCQLMVEGMNDQIEVRQIFDVIESTIDGQFKGWKGNTAFKLKNGQVWQQSSYDYHYAYAYNPEVVIYASGSGYRLMVEGQQETVQVRRIK